MTKRSLRQAKFRRLYILWAILFGLSTTAAYGRSKAQGWCEQGNQLVVTPQTPNSTTKVQRSYPACTITVYNSGTITLAAIYSDNSGTALSNPFTAQMTNGMWSFYSDNGRYDITLSGSGISVPYSIGDVSLFDASTSNFVTGASTLTSIGSVAIVSSAGLLGQDSSALCVDPIAHRVRIGGCPNASYSFDVGSTMRLKNQSTGATTFTLNAGGIQGSSYLFRVADNSDTFQSGVDSTYSFLAPKFYDSSANNSFALTAALGLQLNNTSPITFSSTTSYFGTKDVGIGRASAGRILIYDGINPSNLADLSAKGYTASTGGNVDFSTATSTTPYKLGTLLPVSCSIGQAFFKTDATAGQNLYGCTTTNNWSQLSGGGSGGFVTTDTIQSITALKTFTAGVNSTVFQSTATGSTIAFQTASPFNVQIAANGNASFAGELNLSGASSAFKFMGTTVIAANRHATFRSLTTDDTTLGVIQSAAIGSNPTFQNTNFNFQVDGNGNISGLGSVNLTGAASAYKMGGTVLIDHLSNATFNDVTVNGVCTNCGGGGGGGLPVSDATAIVFKAADSTARARFIATNISTATTRDFTLPNENVTLMGAENSETISGVKTFGALLIANAGIHANVVQSSATGATIAFQTANSNFSVDGNGNLSGAGSLFTLGFSASNAFYPKALASAPATPTSTYGGWAYKSGSTFWYYNNISSTWAQVDLLAGGSGGVTNINGFTGAVGIGGTPNQVNVLNSTNNLILSLPQNIDSAANVNFNTINSSGVVQSQASGGAITFQNSNFNFQVDGNGNVSSTGNMNLNGGSSAYRIRGSTFVDAFGNGYFNNLTIAGNSSFANLTSATAVQAGNTGGSITFQNTNNNFSVNGRGDVSAAGNMNITGYGSFGGVLTSAGVNVGRFNGISARAFNPFDGSGTLFTGQDYTVGFNNTTNKLTVNGTDVTTIKFVGGILATYNP